MKRVIGTSPIEAAEALLEQAEYAHSLMEENSVGYSSAMMIADSASFLVRILKMSEDAKQAAAKAVGE